jgi:hypothetical protein
MTGRGAQLNAEWASSLRAGQLSFFSAWRCGDMAARGAGAVP